MLTDSELKEKKELIDEVERLRKQVLDYGTNVGRKLDLLEVEMSRLLEENERLLTVKDGLTVERDACVALILKLAATAGLRVGVGAGNTAIVDLPSGQVSWVFQDPEGHLFSRFPAYAGAVEQNGIEENYRRVMNDQLEESGA